jgi:pantoate--beta-alanine ligase
MRVVTTVADLRRAVAEARAVGRSIGLVPTMGALHAGHLALVQAARRGAGCTVVSIFVNPLQFGPQEDLSRYPRDLEGDRRLLDGAGVDLVFVPTVAEMYPGSPLIRVDPGRLGGRWEGEVRPGHFAGVLTVVAKLFHQVGPDLVCFGQKDIQQVTLVRRMVRELDWPVEIVVVPTVRDPDGLALSSRNSYLSSAERAEALRLSRALRAVEGAWRAGTTNAAALRAPAGAVLEGWALVRVDYIAIADPATLEPVETAQAGTIVAVAARVGSTRLLDNLILDA